MTLLKIARMGHPVLLRRADDIGDPTAADVRQLARDMVETMRDAEGVGLAAPQIHVSRRIIVFYAPEGRAEEEGAHGAAPLTALINPVYQPLSPDKALGWEGCLSIPGLTGAVPRFRHIGYRGWTPDGQLVEREATGFHARVVQHEIDHLEGILYTMRMNDLSLLSFTEELKHRMRGEDDAADEPQS
ncbi:MAG: peptide deformylase [Rhodospirillales bacterium]